MEDLQSHLTTSNGMQQLVELHGQTLLDTHHLPQPHPSPLLQVSQLEPHTNSESELKTSSGGVLSHQSHLSRLLLFPHRWLQSRLLSMLPLEESRLLGLHQVME